MLFPHSQFSPWQVKFLVKPKNGSDISQHILTKQSEIGNVAILMCTAKDATKELVIRGKSGLTMKC